MIPRSALFTALAVLTLTIPVSAAALWATETQPTDAHWTKGITPEWMSTHMGLELPASTHSAQAAYETTSRFDTGILTFTLTRSEAEKYLAKYPPDGKWLTPPPSQPAKAPHDFAQLGLPEPETLTTGMRYGDVCPDTTDAPHPTSDPQCVNLYAHAYTPTRTRIYVRAHYEPGISPTALPTTFSSSAHTSARSSRALFFGKACSTTSRCSRKP
ncbi:hypothetical protein [Streptomyces bauhiniae]|uniref:hypothetical protein n=1 Tax=Streptomyces bauhiniae TaxID=2340725 RepID=UPI001ABF863E|nr:hypothetical protein [Streptomyces bauhiniae]